MRMVRHEYEAAMVADAKDLEPHEKNAKLM
jgi:hypothetical protein